MKRRTRPEKMVTGNLSVHVAALKEVSRGDDREMGRGLDSLEEHSYLPFRRRERAKLRFRRMRTLPKSASVYASVPNHFPTERHLKNCNIYCLTLSWIRRGEAWFAFV